MAVTDSAIGALTIPARGQALPAPHVVAYRPDIDGLRGVAVACVLMYHAFPAVLPGGFVGVDVFFVISGFLITRLVLTEIRSGDFSVFAFYARRVRRLVPALLVVLAASALFGWFALTPRELSWLGTWIQWGAAFFGNALAAGSGDYFQNSVLLTPLIHLWSLGVEEQFYLVWPLLLLLAARYGATRRVLAAVFLSSLVISVWGALSAPDTHFYRLSTRAWELALGGWVAVAPLQRLGRHAALISTAGAALVLGSALFLDSNAPFPGWLAVGPSCGAALLIAAGPAVRLNRNLLGNAPLVFVGWVSYPLYLWHWPILAFSRIVIGRPLTTLESTGALAAALLCAVGSYYLVERPVRSGQRSKAIVPMLSAGLGILSLTGFCLASGRIPARHSDGAVSKFDAATVDWRLPGRFSYPRTLPPPVQRIPTRNPRTALFIGDSHLAQYWPRAQWVAQREPDRSASVEFITYAGCPPLPGVNTAQPGVVCDRTFEYAAAQAMRPDVETVVFGAFWEGYFLGEFAYAGRRQPLYSRGATWPGPLTLESNGAQQAFADFQQLAGRLSASGRRVYIILSGPTSPLFIPLSLIPARDRLGPRVVGGISIEPERRGVDSIAFEAYVAPVTRRLQAIASRTGSHVIDPRDFLCDGSYCAAVSPSGIPLYVDSNHVRPFFARERALFIDDILLGSRR
jgi:peptidoglycan/LPS O-acetylase OafA/YrhL